MNSSLSRSIALNIFVLLSLAGSLCSDVMVPGSVLDPKTAGEAWNVIRLATKNVELLLEENRLSEIAVQISYSSPSLRALSRLPTTPEVLEQVEELIKRALVSVNAIATAAQQNNPGGVTGALASLRATLDRISPHYDPKAVNADIFFCPTHSDFLSDNQATPCAKCGKRLLTRRIPYSFIYMKPSEPTVRMTATMNGPIVAGQKVEVTVNMSKADKSPVLHTDLLVMETEPIHLLIEEPGLGDYHHEHPVPTKTPGEHAFSFIPKKTGPYRIWADIVPAATGLQEQPFVDLPSPAKADPITDTENRFTSTVGGYQFDLALTNGNHLLPKAGQARRVSVTITAADGKPVTILAPVRNAFGHLVGFCSDYDTVVRLRPIGGNILSPDLRGGPSLGFTLFPPKAGFMRLYCQVLIEGKMLFAPFNLNIQP